MTTLTGFANTAAGGCSSGSCQGCSTAPLSVRSRFGRKALGWAKSADFVVALLGNPNTGKSTLFNALTGLRQHVGNWTGKTVARAEGAYRFGKKSYMVVDLPGSYSLTASSHHEEIARDFVLFGDPAVTVVVVDATRLERNLPLVLQTLEITGSVVVALNLMDEARSRGLRVDARQLSDRLGVPVIPMSARHGEGVAELLKAVERVATGEVTPRPVSIRHADPAVEKAIGELVAGLGDLYPSLANKRWVACRLLENDQSIVAALRDGTIGDIERMEREAMPALAEPLEEVPA